ncbi:MAG: hypothetical protein GY719_43155 [bacterium]|nr:hypothetical protein [bacterium]
MAKKTPQAPRELERSGALCLAFANTEFPVRDHRLRDSERPSATRLESYDDLVTWTQRMGVLGAAEGKALRRAAAARPEEAAAVVAGALKLRKASMRIFTALALGKEPRASDLDVVNRSLGARGVAAGPDGFRREWTGDPEALDRVLWPIAQSTVELLCSDRHHKVRQCGAEDCYQLFVHANRRRVWCDVNTCGSRDRGRRHHRQLRQIKKRIDSMTPMQQREHMERAAEAARQRRERKRKALADLERRRAERAAGSKKAEQPGAGQAEQPPENQ